MNYNMEFSDERMNVSIVHIEKREVRGSSLRSSFCASFFGMLFYKHHSDFFNVTYPDFTHISFFKQTSEYLEYILEKKVSGYKLNRDPTEVSKGYKSVNKFIVS
jgi:hypothetical protein